MKPVLFELMRSLTPASDEMVFIDERVDKLPEIIDSDIIAFSVETYTAKRAYILARKYKTDRNIIVMGGFHPTILPDEPLQYADTVIVGDAEDTWGEFIADCRAGLPKRKYISSESMPLKSFAADPTVYRHRYHNIGVYQASRGCKFNCDFCSIKTIYSRVRRKPIEDVVNDLRQMREKIIFFADDNLFYDEAGALELFRAIAPLRKRWACQISMDAAKNDTLLEEMKKAGCFLVLLGFESLNRSSLSNMHKIANQSVEDYEAIIARIYRHRLMIYGTFVFGYDDDTPELFDRTLAFAEKNHFAITNFNPLIPMPGTGVYRRLEKEGRLLYDQWWLSNEYRYGETTFQPKGMSPGELRDGCIHIRKRFYSFGSIVRRLFAWPTLMFPWNFTVFLLMNFISRKEIRSKQGQILGGTLHEARVD